MSEAPTGKAKHTELSLDQIAEMQPGLADLMPHVGERFWIAYYAAKGGNWAFAAYQLRHLALLLRQGAVTRPKHAANLSEYERVWLTRLQETIKQKDLASFERAFAEATDEANRLHRDLGHPDIVWRLPSRPPEQFDLGPQPEPAPKLR